jgi:hypothetical protein
MSVQEYLRQWIRCGGEWITVGELYATTIRSHADAWLMGYERTGGEFYAKKPHLCACGCGERLP